MLSQSIETPMRFLRAPAARRQTGAAACREAGTWHSGGGACATVDERRRVRGEDPAKKKERKKRNSASERDRRSPFSHSPARLFFFVWHDTRQPHHPQALCAQLDTRDKAGCTARLHSIATTFLFPHHAAPGHRRHRARRTLRVLGRGRAGAGGVARGRADGGERRRRRVVGGGGGRVAFFSITSPVVAARRVAATAATARGRGGVAG